MEKGLLTRTTNALRDLIARCDGAEGVRADGSNIDTCAAHAALDEAQGVLDASAARKAAYEAASANDGEEGGEVA